MPVYFVNIRLVCAIYLLLEIFFSALDMADPMVGFEEKYDKYTWIWELKQKKARCWDFI